MCAKYSLPPFDWLKLSHHLVSGESTLHEVTLFEARSRIFLPTAESCAALFCCRLATRASSLGWLVGNNEHSKKRTTLFLQKTCYACAFCYLTVNRVILWLFQTRKMGEKTIELFCRKSNYDKRFSLFPVPYRSGSLSKHDSVDRDMQITCLLDVCFLNLH